MEEKEDYDEIIAKEKIHKNIENIYKMIAEYILSTIDNFKIKDDFLNKEIQLNFNLFLFPNSKVNFHSYRINLNELNKLLTPFKLTNAKDNPDFSLKQRNVFGLNYYDLRYENNILSPLYISNNAKIFIGNIEPIELKYTKEEFMTPDIKNEYEKIVDILITNANISQNEYDAIKNKYNQNLEVNKKFELLLKLWYDLSNDNDFSSFELSIDYINKLFDKNQINLKLMKAGNNDRVQVKAPGVSYYDLCLKTDPSFIVFPIQYHAKGVLIIDYYSYIAYFK